MKAESAAGFFATRLAATLSLVVLTACAQQSPEVVMHKDPNCGCCTAWAAHLEAEGFRVRTVVEKDMDAIKRQYAVPPGLTSCHTATVDGYVIEGHVPAAAIRRLLKERPQAGGLAVPGMPAGSPGMEVPGQKESYDVVVFGPSGQTQVFERH